MDKTLLKKAFAEMFGTCVLVMVACGVAVTTYLSPLATATSLAFGLVIVAMAYTIGSISGCHINPAVSLAMALRKEITWKEFLVYVCSQVIGALVGSLLLALCLGGKFEALGGNEIQAMLKENGELTAWSYISAFLVEVLLTMIFVFVIIAVTNKKFSHPQLAGLIIGLTLTLVHLFGLAFTGTSVNPARSLAPALLQAIGGETTSLTQVWIWILAPMAGSAVATFLYKFLFDSKEEAKEETETLEVSE